MKPFPGKLERRDDLNGGPYVMTDEQLAWFRKWFPVTENARVAAAMGVGQSFVHRIARKEGLKKTAAGLKGIMKRTARRIKKKCEKNGWYDSLKGKAPSEQCMRAYNEYLHSDRYVHPMNNMRKKNPKRYARLMKERSEHRKELWRKERMRMLYGMDRKTGLKVVLKKYTRRQVCHRSNALKYGYFLSTDSSEQGGERYIIFYDDNTRRSDIFERNCVADGFTFKYEQS